MSVDTNMPLLHDVMVVMQVFRDPNGFNHVKSCLFKLGMDPGQLQQVCLVLKTIQELLTKTTTAQALSNMSVTKLPNDLPAENSLVQLLYAYLVQWIGKCYNSACAGLIFGFALFSQLGKLQLPQGWQAKW